MWMDNELACINVLNIVKTLIIEKPCPKYFKTRGLRFCPPLITTRRVPTFSLPPLILHKFIHIIIIKYRWSLSLFCLKF